MNPSGNGNNDHTMHPDVEAIINSEAAMFERHQELVKLEAQVEREKQRKRELEGLVPPLQMDDVNYEQLEQLRNSLMIIKHRAEAKAACVMPSPP